MILDQIKSEHLIDAGNSIDLEGIPLDFLYCNYYVVLPNDRQYPFKHLVRTAQKLVSGKEYNKFNFKSNKNYRKYIEGLGFPIVFYKEGISFFEKEEISHYEQIAGKPYRSANDQNVRDSNILLPLVRKVNCWAKNSRVDGFQYKSDHHWQWSGTFKSYLWIRLFRPDHSKKVYFIVGIEGGI